MKVFQAHCFYSRRGGEDVVVEREAQLLRDAGIELIPWYQYNPATSSLLEKARLGWQASWRCGGKQQLIAMQAQKGDILHVHNFFPQLSPAVFYQAKALGMKTVLTLHNFRCLTPSAMLPEGDARYSVAHTLSQCWQASYQNSILASLAVGTMIESHRVLGTWHKQVDCFICPSDYVRKHFIKVGFAADKLRVLPHFYPSTSKADHNKANGARDYALFVGRESAEKGLDNLLHAWRHVEYPLVVAGANRPTADIPERIRFVGQVEQHYLSELYQGAALLIAPSGVAETFGNVVMEAFAHGTPALVSKKGALMELVQPGYNGEWIESADWQILAGQLNKMLAQPLLLEEMGKKARQTFLQRYTPQVHSQALLSLYNELSAGM
ncbi:hypothetical protein GCM10009092_00780 [Bowmanella denitrificans]|uniref:Uncharacterized protein n=1 Tax=Bowmanella denitrificans TaxID=366582 RepID=A0ABP3GAN4_9ALTE